MPSLRWLAALSFFLVCCLAQDYTCSSSKPCKQGCCGNSGYCGYGPTYCGQGNCTSSCNAKSECDAGWGPAWSAASKCPLNVCCSKYGYCGTSADFCGAGNSLVPAPSCSGSSANARTIGYYEGWSITRPCQGKFPEDLDLTAYTHLNFAFAYIDPNTFQLAPMQITDNGLYLRTTLLKRLNPGLKVFISVGGWSMNDPGPTAAAFSNLVSSTANQNAFISSLISFMQTYGFDGVDLDWEYPVAPERAGNPADFTNYVTFIANLRSSLAATGGHYGLTLTLPASYWYLRNFDIVNLQPYVDWFNFLSYDLHGTWDASNPYVGSVIGAHTNLTEIDAALNLLWRNKIDPNKVVLGLGFYGRSFTLQTRTCKTAGCPFSAGGNPGDCTQTSGILSGIEIASILANGSATTTWDKTAAVKIATYNGNQWVSYDDADTFAQKVNYANANCLGGTMVWAIDLDDGSLAKALSQTTGRQNLSNSGLPNGGRSATFGKKAAAMGNNLAEGSTPLGECGFTTCQATRAQARAMCGRMGKLVSAETTIGCLGYSSEFGGDTYRAFCCPEDNAPTCTVRGVPSLPRSLEEPMRAHCHADEVAIQYYQAFRQAYALCCSNTISDYPFGQCQWSISCGDYGSDANCPSAFSAAVAWSSIGSNTVPCQYPSTYTLCCDSKAAPVNCQVYDQPGYATAPGSSSLALGLDPISGVLGAGQFNFGDIGSCNGQCGDAQILVGTDPQNCLGGSKAICCQQNGFPNNQELQNFKNKLIAFRNNPTCSPKQINNILHALTRRSDLWIRGGKWSIEAARSFVRKRDLDTIGYADIAFLVDAFQNSPQDSYAKRVTDIFDSVFAPFYYASNFTTINNIVYGNGASAGSDPTDPIETFVLTICDLRGAQDNIATTQADSDGLCIPDPCLHGDCANGGRPYPSSDAPLGYACSNPNSSSRRGSREEIEAVFESAVSYPKDYVTAVSYEYIDDEDEDLQDLSKRIISQGNRPNNVTLPTNCGRIMQAIRGGDRGPQPPALYFRTFTDPSNAQDTLMEIAWDIRQRPDLNGGDPANIFVVLHVHTNGLCSITDAQQGIAWHPRIPRAHFYHGRAVQNIRGSGNPLWAVQFYPLGGNPRRPNGGETARTQFLNCRPANLQTTAQNYRTWVPPFTLGFVVQLNGVANQPPARPIPGGGETDAFGRFLVQQGFLVGENYHNWNVVYNRWDRIDPATNANRLPNGTAPANMDPNGPNGWPQGDPPIN